MNLYPSIPYAPIELVSVCDIDEDRRRGAKKGFGAEAEFSSVEEMLQGPDLDALLICGPPEMHREVGVIALQAGKHVFMEKPPAPDLGGALELQEAARTNGKICMVGFMKRFALRYVQARQILQSAEFGRLTQVTIKYSHWNLRSLDEMLLYMSVHPLDLMRFFLGDLERVTIEHLDLDGQHTFTLVFRSKQGSIGTLITSSQEPRLKEHVELVGEGSLEIVKNVVELEYHHSVRQQRNFTNDLGDIDLVRPDFGIPNQFQNTLFLQGYAGELKEFAEAVLEDRQPSVTIADGVEAMRLVDLMAKTAIRGSYVRMGDRWEEA
jgi:myo-inositol 2-dehydrogenase/D-chiro-inositol 1-dehydrogenase